MKLYRLILLIFSRLKGKKSGSGLDNLILQQTPPHRFHGWLLKYTASVKHSRPDPTASPLELKARPSDAQLQLYHSTLY
jgi:hypothetical protein